MKTVVGLHERPKVVGTRKRLKRVLVCDRIYYCNNNLDHWHQLVLCTNKGISGEGPLHY